MKSNKKQKESNSNHSDKDRYLITYADLITLLLGLFVILYASSQIDLEKFGDVSAALSSYFKTQPARVLEGGDGVLEGNRDGVPQAILQPRQAKTIEQIEGEAIEALSDYIQKGLISLRRLGNGIIIVLPERLLFQSGRAEIQPEGSMVIDTLTKMLGNFDYSIMVDGHTDSNPIRTFQYESNWHLSVARALNVGYRMIRLGVPEQNFIIRGFGSQRPASENLTPEGRSQNRRVEITISPLEADAPANISDTLQAEE